MDFQSIGVEYIHNNPVHHHVHENFGQWKYSSWQALTGTMETKLAREEVVHFFGSRSSFLLFISNSNLIRILSIVFLMVIRDTITKILHRRVFFVDKQRRFCMAIDIRSDVIPLVKL
jgi:hypothetical protein